MTLYDHRGRAVSTAKLRREQAEVSIGGVRQPFEADVVMGMTPAKLIDILRRADDGDHFDYLTMAGAIERRDAHTYSCLTTRKLGVFSLPDQVDAVDDSAEETEIAEAVEQLTNTPEFHTATIEIMDGLFRGYSVTEIDWDTSELQWYPTRYDLRKPQFFQWDSETASKLRLVDGTPEGAELWPYKYIQHIPKIVGGSPVAGGLARIIAALHVFKGYAIKDWMAFAEVFGMPWRIGKYKEGATPEQKAALELAVKMIGSDAACTIPDTMEIVIERAAMSGNAGSDQFFRELLNAMNKEISKAILGQTMTTEDGSSLAQAAIHNEVRIDWRNADAFMLAATINRDLIVPFVQLNFGKRRAYPKWQKNTEEPTDMALLAQAIPPFVSLGLPVPIAWAQERLGVPQPENGEPVLSMPTAPEPSEDEPKEERDNAKLVALRTWIDVESQRTTNMRVFRKRVAEMLQKTA